MNANGDLFAPAPGLEVAVEVAAIELDGSGQGSLAGGYALSISKRA
jgi:hypothetical protein